MSTVTEPRPGPRPQSGFSTTTGPQSLGEAASAYVQKVRGGDVGSLPAVAGLIALVIVFAALRPSTFTTAFNVANLINQSAGVIVIAMGLIFVLLLGEIDLSAGYTAAPRRRHGHFMTKHGWPWPLALVMCLLTGAVVGTCIGLLVAYLGIPSFVVTLAAFLGLQGLLLVLIGEGGTIAYRNNTILAIMNKNLPVWLGWALFIVGVGVYAARSRSGGRSRAGRPGWPATSCRCGRPRRPRSSSSSGWSTFYLSRERSKNPDVVSLKGVPIVVAVLFGLFIVLTFALTRTSWGRHVYAVGGNAEAARRAGINVPVIKLSCFVICSTLAAVAGILLASRDNSVSPTTGGQQTLLYAVGAAVIGGTSLFGGKGRIVDAIIGGLVVAVIDNGMSLLNQSPGRVYMVTGLVLLSRRRSTR